MRSWFGGEATFKFHLSLVTDLTLSGLLDKLRSHIPALPPCCSVLVFYLALPRMSASAWILLYVAHEFRGKNEPHFFFERELLLWRFGWTCRVSGLCVASWVARMNRQPFQREIFLST